MPAHNAKITETGLVELLRSYPGKGFRIEDLSDHFNCGFTAASMVARRMCLAGMIRCTDTPGRGRARFYHVGALITDKTAAAVAPVAPYVGEIVPGFKPDMWKPPMQGYEASLRSFAERALATRRA